MTQGEATLKRAFTPPESWVRSVCQKTGADPAAAIEERNEAAEGWAAFVADLAGVHEEHAVLTDLGIDKPQKGNLPSLNINLISIGLTVYRVFGRSTAKRMLTVPRSTVAAICAKTGADIQEVLAARDAAVDDTLDFIESLVDSDFVDPD